jgi:hypothetical protein
MKLREKYRHLDRIRSDVASDDRDHEIEVIPDKQMHW